MTDNLTADFTRSLPGGKLDDSTYETIESALDRLDAPMQDGSRWLSLPERIAALGRELSLLRITAATAEELVSPAGMLNRGVGRGLVVVEKADKTDPHYRLCTALETLRAVRKAD